MKLLTPFYDKHLEYGVTLIDVRGWQLAAVYTSVEEEYRMVRERAGFIDYSFQSAIAVAGRDAFSFLQKILDNDLRKISSGKAIYSSILDETGKIERYHRTIKGELSLMPYEMPGELEEALRTFIDYYNHRRYHEGLGDVTPYDVYTGRHLEIIQQRKEARAGHYR